jgi:hypothetical protein
MSTEPPNQKPKEVRYCRACGKVLKYWRSPFCSDECAASGATQPKAEPKQSKPPVSIEPTDAQPKVAETVPNERVSKRGRLNEGAPTKATDETLAAILDDMAQYGMTQQQAAAGHGVSPETFSRWKADPKYEGLRDRAQYIQIKNLMAKFENAPPGEYKRFGWLLEKIYRLQYGDPAKIGVQLNQQFNGSGPVIDSARLEEMRKRLDEIDLIQAHWKAGTATNDELRKILIEKIGECQHVVDCIDAGETPDQETQQQLYRDHEEGRDRREPVQEAIGRVVSPDLLAIEDASEPTTAATVTRAGDVDPLSGQPAPSEHIRQRDRQLAPGPPSERQRMLAQDRRMGRSDGDRKNPFSGG